MNRKMQAFRTFIIAYELDHVFSPRDTMIDFRFYKQQILYICNQPLPKHTHPVTHAEYLACMAIWG